MSDIIRVIEVDEDIWAPTPEERAEKGDFLSLDDQKGIIQLNLIAPLELTDQEPVGILHRKKTTSLAVAVKGLTLLM